jgi:hypothetical protein
VRTFLTSAALIATFVELCVNASLGELELELVYDVTPASDRHEFTQSFQFDWPLVPVPGRKIDIDVVHAVLKSFHDHVEQPRIIRALAQYSEALKRWRPFHGLLCVAHLYMCVEALTKAVLRDHCRKVGKSEEELIQEWGIERRQLDSEVRRRLIFCGDNTCYTKAVDTSNAFEHGFEDLGSIQQQAKEVVVPTASYLMKAILDLLNLDDAIRDRLLRSEYASPRGPLLLIHYLHGTLLGKAEDLPAVD